MSTVELFWQYAEKALRQAVQSKNEKEQLALIELARTWTQTAEATSQGAAPVVPASEHRKSRPV